MFTTAIGIGAALVAGVLNGSFMAPMKRTSKWEWENVWLLYAVWAMVIIPWLLALATVPRLFDVYREVDTGVLVRVVALGAGWGLGAVTFGLGMHMVGLSLGYSIIIGMTAVTGSLIPMLIRSPETLTTPGGLVILLGMVVVACGVGLCGSAGMIRERSAQSERIETSQRSNRFALGFLVCLASGIFNAMLNLSLASAQPITQVAEKYVTGTLANFRVGNAVWTLTLAGGFVANLLYCGMLLLRKKTWKRYGETGTSSYWFWAFLMGALWMGCIALYGAGAQTLGELGTTVGWLILMATSVLIGNLWGILTGEWKDAPGKARQRMVQGLALSLCSIILVSIGQSMLG